MNEQQLIAQVNRLHLIMGQQAEAIAFLQSQLFEANAEIRRLNEVLANAKAEKASDAAA